MKNAIIGLVLLTGCSPSVEEIEAYRVARSNKLETYVVDSCEYVGYLSSSPAYGFLTHKGNCKFCIKRSK